MMEISKVSNKDDIINETYYSKRTNRKKIINTILKGIKGVPISIKFSYDVLFLIIDEALTNAMEHGNQWDPDKHVNVKVTQKDKHISITIEDQGTGFNPEFINQKPVSFKELTPGGRGIHIIKHYCNPRWNDMGNQINLPIEIE